jgi:hypothetical protein
LAKTRTQIKTTVDNNTGRGTEKATLIETLCDEGLKVALLEHPFRDARSTHADVSITEDATTVDISAITSLVDILTVRVVEASGVQNKPLLMRDDVWWSTHVINAEDRLKGWPEFGLKDGTSILIDRPADDNLELRLRVTTEQTFANDAAECPIGVLDTFIGQYATAYVFLSIEDLDKYNYWKRIALGWKWDDGVVGGSLKHAIDNDKRSAAEETSFEPPILAPRVQGISVQNLISGHDNYGGYDWYT